MEEQLPLDIIFEIRSFLFKKCAYCDKEKYVDTMLKNVTTYYYCSLFDDDYPFPRIHGFFKYLCHPCKNRLFEYEQIRPFIPVNT